MKIYSVFLLIPGTGKVQLAIKQFSTEYRPDIEDN
ncbi:hypothetical protein V1477_013302, partial [Vespula maculifrons]